MPSWVLISSTFSGLGKEVEIGHSMGQPPDGEMRANSPYGLP